MEGGWSEGGGRGPRPPPPHAGNPHHAAAAAAAGYDQRGPYPGPNFDARVRPKSLKVDFPSLRTHFLAGVLP